MIHIPPETRIYGLRDLENLETAAKEGRDDLDKRIDKEERVEPERETELEAQYDEEEAIEKERERLQLIKDLTEGESSFREARPFRGLDDASKEKRPSALEPFEK